MAKLNIHELNAINLIADPMERERVKATRLAEKTKKELDKAAAFEKVKAGWAARKDRQQNAEPELLATGCLSIPTGTSRNAVFTKAGLVKLLSQVKEIKGFLEQMPETPDWSKIPPRNSKKSK